MSASPTACYFLPCLGLKEAFAHPGTSSTTVTMPHAEPPRKISMAYILGLSPHPFKQPKPSLPPPRSNEPNPFVNMMTTPGAVLEWAASDGRKGKLSTPGPPKLTSRNLAKVPSEKPIGKKTASTQAHRASKEQSRKKEKKEEVQDWGAAANGWGETKAASAAGSKKSNKDEATGWGETGDNAWNNDAAAGSTKSKASKKSGSNDSKKVEPAADAGWGDTTGGTWGDTGAIGETDANATADKSWDNTDANADEKKDDGNAWGDTNGGFDAGTANAGNTNPKTDDNAKDDDNAAEGSSDWTADQDAELMKFKSENASMSWEAIAEKLGKGTKESCKTRFNEIKPKDWKPQGKGQGGGGGKKEKGKGNKNNQAKVKEAEKEKDNDTGSDGFLGGGLFDNLDMGDNAAGGGGPIQSPIKASGFDGSADMWATNANTSWGPQIQQQAPAANDLSNAIAAAMKSPGAQAFDQQFTYRSPDMKPPIPFSATFQNTPHHFSRSVGSHDTFHDI
jgi:hypothetical protein